MTSYVTNKTKVSDVSSWEELYSSDYATVWEANNIYGFYKVKTAKTTKYFKGETAWMKIQSYVVDLGDYNGWYIFK